jgi:hypothetical protein
MSADVGQTAMKSTVRYLDMETNAAPALSEQTEI